MSISVITVGVYKVHVARCGKQGSSLGYNCRLSAR